MYLDIEQYGHVYDVENTNDMFSFYRTQCGTNPNLIKKYDVFAYEFVRRTDQNWLRLSFRGKILRVNYDSWFAIEEFLSRLSSLFDSVENGALNFVAELFGLNVAV